MSAFSESPKSGPWKCFHCEEVLIDEASALLHFGSSQYQDAACQIDLKRYREMEEDVRRCREDDSETDRAMHRMQNDHQQALLRAEERGYAKGLKDYTALESALQLAKMDGERLDFVLNYAAILAVSTSAVFENMHRLAYRNEWDWSLEYLHSKNLYFGTPRQAIDAAIARQRLESAAKETR